MSLVKWGSLKELEEMRRDMDRLFDELFTPGLRRRRALGDKSETGIIVPNIELYDRTNEIVFRADLPGVKKEDIELSITKDSLTVKGELKKEEEIKAESYYVSEKCYGSFSRSVALPVEVNSEKATATFKDGILQVVIPKQEEAKPKEIKIAVS